MSKTISVDIITPQRTVYSGQVISFTAPGVEGLFQILFNHAPFLSALSVGPMKLKTEDNQTIKFATSGGFAHILQNRITVLAETAERGDSIDIARAQEAKKRAEERLASKNEMNDDERARIALLRAINRLKIAGAL